MATPRLVTVAATQMSCSPNAKDNVAAAEALVRRAAAAGAQVCDELDPAVVVETLQGLLLR